MFTKIIYVPHLVSTQQVMVMAVNGVDGVNADGDVSTLNCNSLKTRIIFNLYLNPQHHIHSRE